MNLFKKLVRMKIKNRQGLLLWVCALIISAIIYPAQNVLADSVVLLPIIASGESATIQEQDDQPDIPVAIPDRDPVTGQTLFYVSKSGNNRDGVSWESAWNELDQIDWRQIGPGALILIDGGSKEMVYSTSLHVTKSGTELEPITIQLSQESGRNGMAIFNGGRGVALPYCGQKSYPDSAQNGKEYGISIANQSWVVIDGTKWRGITIHKYTRSGLLIDRGSSHVTARNLEIYDNGEARRQGDGWAPARPGINLGGSGHTLDRLIVHDNGEDAIQSLWGENQLSDLTITRSWLHNERRHPSVNESSNYCTHSDGLQIYDGGVISGITVEESIIGPGFTNGVMLGQSLIGNNTWADVQDVTFRNVIFSKAVENGIYGYAKTNSQNWILENVTLDCSNTKYNCLRIENSRHSVQDSIINGSRVDFEDGLDTYNNNCQWNTQGFAIGSTANPMFRSTVSNDLFALADYTMDSNSPCRGKGAALTSVQNLLETAVNPTPNPVPQSPVSGTKLSCKGTLIEAESGVMFGQFKREDGHILHEIDTDKPWLGGSVTYQFETKEPGHYQIRALVSASHTGANSYFVNVDSQPTGDYMIWDIDYTDGFEARMVSWRGSGTHEKNQFTPMAFRLAPGSHQLIMRGRERDTMLDKICIEKR